MPAPRAARPIRLTATSLSLGMVAVTVLALGSKTLGWPMLLELASHFQVQYAAIAILLVIPLLVTQYWPAMSVGLFCLVLLLSQLLPWYLPSETRQPGPPNLRLLVANLNTQNLNFSALLGLIDQEQPDLILLMEVSRAWIEPLEPVRQKWPEVIGQTAENNFGIALYSRFPIQGEIAYLADEPTPAVLAQIQHPVQKLAFVGMHPFPPIRPALFHSRNRQFDLAIRHIQQQSMPVILAGDLNATPWSPYLQRLTRKTGLHNARQGFGIFPTWPASGTYQNLPDWLIGLLLIPIDHCLISPNLRVSDFRGGPAIGSDHLPILVDLVIPISAAASYSA